MKAFRLPLDPAESPIPTLDLRDAERIKEGLVPLGRACERCGYEKSLWQRRGFWPCNRPNGQSCGMYRRHPKRLGRLRLGL